MTSANYRPQGRKRRLGIILDEELLSAPALQAVIRETGEITGDFSQADVDWMVGILNSGSLPAALAKTPIGKETISPTLGEITIKKGSYAIAYSLIGILVFMPIYYRFSGLVAGFALVSNLLLVVGVMIGVGAAFTLPGLAGLVLTVGMAVDANVLIFERIREERDRGAALRMAIRNGFGRATRTIVDANMTTLIVGIVLYGMGSDQIKGFAVTLILGILMSMFTAIFCSRIIFDIAERMRWITQLNMTQIVGKTEFDFIAKRYIAAALSISIIAVGIYGVYHRGKDLFDIDFVGGSRVEAEFKEAISSEDVEGGLIAYSDQLPVEARLDDLIVKRTGDQNVKFIIETTQQDLPNVEDAIKSVFAGKLVTNNINYDPSKIRTISASTNAKAEREPDAARSAEVDENTLKSPAVEDDEIVAEDGESAAGDDAANKRRDETGDQPASDDGARRTDLPPRSLIALADESEFSEGDGSASDAVQSVGVEPDDGSTETSEKTPPSEETPPSEKTAPSDEAATDEPADAEPAGDVASQDDSSDTDSTETADATADNESAADDAAGGAKDDAQDGKDEQPPVASDPIPQPPSEDTPLVQSPRFEGGTEVDLVFDNPINKETLTKLAKQFISELSLPMPDLEVTSDDVTGDSIKSATDWKLQSTLSETDVKSVLAKFEADMKDEPIFGASTNIRGQIAGSMRTKAIKALIASLMCIVAYIWLRFQRVTYGLAAVVALIHDVMVTLGVIALSGYFIHIPAIADVLLIERFKLSLVVLAAFLTIIGYSLNDTIVIFDRIREVRGRSPHLTSAIINTSINQTLSRTMLTSLTTLIVVVTLYFIGGPGIHGFAFALVIGVIVGTYSSMFVASPVLLWMTGLRKAADPNAAVARPTSAPVA